MVSLFDLEKLTALLRDFYQITNIRITIFDEEQKELISYPQRVAPYCEIIRSVPRGYEACMKCDRVACEKALKRRGTYLYRCHAGFTEAVTPLFIRDVLAGYLFFGHVFSYPSRAEGWSAVDSYTEELHLNRKMLQAALEDAKYIPEETVRSAAHILRAVASFLIMERMASLQQDQIAVKLDSYLTSHYTEKITVSSLCKVLEIGKTQLYKLAHLLYGCGISQRVRFLRIERAKELLTDSEQVTLTEVSDQCGFDSYNYFISVFSKETGCSPGAWRKSNERN